MSYLKKYLTVILAIPLISCVAMNVPQKDLTVEDVKGSWEGIFPLFISYCRLEIDQEGEGYFVIVFKKDDLEFSKIASISTSGKEITIKLQDGGSDFDESFIMKGVVLYDRMYLEATADNLKEKMVILLLRNSSFNIYRELANDRINELNKK